MTVFSPEWFDWHQDRLLWLVNHRSRSVRRMMRGALRIRPHDAGYQRPIVRLLPHAYVAFDGWHEGQPRLIGDFRTHNKYAKRLYYAFHPIWRGMHEWDAMVADRLAPELLSFGFDTLTVFPNADADAGKTTCDGSVARDFPVDESWAVIIAGAGNAASTDGATVFGFVLEASATTNQFVQCGRFICLFDTAALGAGSTITATVLSLWATAKQDSLTDAPDWDIYTSTPASNTAVVAADYSQLGSTSQTGSPLSYASTTTAAYQDFTFNATGRGNVSLTSISKFGVRNANRDVAAVQPNWVSGARSRVSVATADTAGTSNDPKLVVTYTPAASGWAPRIRRGMMGIGR